MLEYILHFVGFCPDNNTHIDLINMYMSGFHKNLFSFKLKSIITFLIFKR